MLGNGQQDGDGDGDGNADTRPVLLPAMFLQHDCMSRIPRD